MSVTLRILTAFACVFAATSANAQTPNRNNPYTPSPVAVGGATTQNVSFVRSDVTAAVYRKATADLTPASDRSISRSATDIYRVGVGDVIYVNITNSSNGKGFYQVRNNGTIDFPLAGENVIVLGKTVDAIRTMLEAAITLYGQPKVEVKVREYASHRVTLSGLISNGGTIFIRREAVPLFVIFADAGVNPAAAKVIVRDGKTNTVNTYDMRDANTGNIVINAGDSIEFTGI